MGKIRKAMSVNTHMEPWKMLLAYSYTHVRVYFMQVRNLQRFHTVSTRITNALTELKEQLN